MPPKELALVVVLGAAFAPAAAAQSFSPEMTKAIQACTLDSAKANAVMKAQAQLTELLTGDPARMKEFPASLKMTAEEQIAEMEKDPAESAILKANGLRGKDYFTGLMALRAAAWASAGQKGPLTALASPANVSFLKAHPKILAEFNRIEGGGTTK
jgi:hypothetical protein